MLVLYYDRLVKAGKPKMVALMAAAHKLLTILNAMVRDEPTGKSREQRPRDTRPLTYSRQLLHNAGCGVRLSFRRAAGRLARAWRKRLT